MNNTNWFNHDASSTYQNELYRSANNERLANEARNTKRQSAPAVETRKESPARTTQTTLKVKPV